MDTHKQIKSFIEKNFMFIENTVSFEDDTSFLESGIIDSTGILELVSFLEELFSITIEDDELIEITPKNIRLRKKHLNENDRKRHSRQIKS